MTPRLWLVVVAGKVIFLLALLLICCLSGCRVEQHDGVCPGWIAFWIACVAVGLLLPDGRRR